MAFEIFKLFGSIFVDTSAANSEMDKASTNAEVLGKKFGNVATTAGKISDGLKTVGRGFTTYVTAPLIALGTASVMAFNEVDDGADKILTMTGAVGEKAQELDAIYKNVAKTIPDTFDNIASSVGSVSQRFNVTGDQLQSMSEDFLKFSRVTGTDVTEAVRLVGRAMGDAGIPADQYKGVLDELTKASQTSGISIETLTENLAKYGAPMRALGFDTEESIAIFAGWEKAGVNTEIAFSGMKKAISNWSAEGKDARTEFKNTLKAIQETPDIATATGMAIDVFGQKAGPDLADAIKNGRFSYEDFLKIIENSEGTLDSSFGAIQDSGDKFTLALNKIKMAGSELGEVVLNTLAPMLDSLADKISKIGEWFSSLNERQQEGIVKFGLFAAAIGPVLLILGSMAGAVSNIAGLFAGGGILNSAIGSVSAALGIGAESAGGMGAALAALTGPVAIVIGIIAALIAVLVGAWQNSETFRNSVTTAFEDIKTKIQESLTVISAALAPVGEVFSSAFSQIAPVLQQIGDILGTYVVPAIANFVTGFVDGFATVITAVAPLLAILGNLLAFVINFVGFIVAILQGDWSSAWNYAGGMVQAMSDAVANIINALLGIITAVVSNIYNGVTTTFENLKNSVVNTFNGLVSSVQGIWDTICKIFSGEIPFPKIPMPHVNISGSFSLNPPSAPSFGIDWYAKGGVMNDPTIFGAMGSTLLGGGEAGPEAIAPISVLQKYIMDAVNASNDSAISILTEMLTKIDKLGLTVNFYKQVDSPYETARAIKNLQKELTY